MGQPNASNQMPMTFLPDFCGLRIVFAVVVTWIAVFQGYDLLPTSEGISRATTRTVVYSSLAVLGLDFILTAVMFGGL